MNALLPVVAAFCLSTASAQHRMFSGITGAVSKHIAAIKDPIDKTVASVAFSNCANVKKILGYDFSSYRGDETDLSSLKLYYITSDVKIQYRLSSLKTLPQMPNFDSRKGLAIYIHGFIDNPDKASFSEVKDAFIQQGNYNILALDASPVMSFSYLHASTMVRFIGQALGSAMADMMQAGLNPVSIHLVGHSLGCHIASFAGKTVYSLTQRQVGRITGLDPAGPCFADVDSTIKLSRTDAMFVDVIHTDAGVYGLHEQVGHIDFYPNGGSHQPLCVLQTCSHSRAWELFAESVLNPAGFPAVLCHSWHNFKNKECDYNYISYMGYASRPGYPKGKYYLQTAERPPYALGTAGITFTNRDVLLKSLVDTFSWQYRRNLFYNDTDKNTPIRFMSKGSDFPRGDKDVRSLTSQYGSRRKELGSSLNHISYRISNNS